MKFKNVVSPAVRFIDFAGGQVRMFIPVELRQRNFIDIREQVKVGRRTESVSIAIFDETAPTTLAVRSVSFINSKSTRTSHGLLAAYERERRT